jgi:hypothetical protein
MKWDYPATYSDKRGLEATTIMNDSRELTVSLRGVTLAGVSFDDLEPKPNSDPLLLEQFVLNQGSLCACQITCQIPLPVACQGRTVDAILEVHLVLGGPAPNGGIDHEELALTLHVDGQAYKSRGHSGWFEDELLDLQKSLPIGTHMKACINCAFSDYSPYGHGLFGSMACFRGCKQEYLEVRSKDDIFRIWDKNAGFVQETYLCPEFETRRPSTGYRG